MEDNPTIIVTRIVNCDLMQNISEKGAILTKGKCLAKMF